MSPRRAKERCGSLQPALVFERLDPPSGLNLTSFLRVPCCRLTTFPRACSRHSRLHIFKSPARFLLRRTILCRPSSSSRLQNHEFHVGAPFARLAALSCNRGHRQLSYGRSFMNGALSGITRLFEFERLQAGTDGPLALFRLRPRTMRRRPEWLLLPPRRFRVRLVRVPECAV